MKADRKEARAKREASLWGPRFAAAETPETLAHHMWDLLRSRIRHLPPSRRDEAWLAAAAALHASAECANTRK